MEFTAAQIDNLLYTNFLIIGVYKTGKTRSCATLHKLKSRPWVQGKKLYIYDFDEGCQPIIRVARNEGWVDELKIFRFPRVGGEKLPTTDFAATAAAYRTKEPITDFLTAVNSLYDHVTPDGSRWKDDFVNEAPYAIVVDSATPFQDDILGFTLTLRHKNLGEEHVDGRAEYGLQMGKFVEIIRSMRALPCFSVVLAHEQNVMGKVKMPSAPKGGKPIDPVPTGVVSRLPVVTGILANSIGGEFGAVFFTEVVPETSDRVAYKWVTRPYQEIRGAGSRLIDNLPIFVDQDFDKVVVK